MKIISEHYEKIVKEEGDYRTFVHKGLRCRILRHPELLHLCGYVGVPKSNKYFGKGYDDVPAEIHGGLTYADGNLRLQPEKNLWWFGFDTGHLGDKIISDPLGYGDFGNGVYRTMKYTEEETKNLAEFLNDGND